MRLPYGTIYMFSHTSLTWSVYIACMQLATSCFYMTASTTYWSGQRTRSDDLFGRQAMDKHGRRRRRQDSEEESLARSKWSESFDRCAWTAKGNTCMHARLRKSYLIRRL